MKMNVPDPSLQITTLLAIVEKMTSKDPVFRHCLHAVITENDLQGLVRQRQTLELWSYRLVYIVSDTGLPSYSRFAELSLSAIKFAIVFRGSPSLPFIHPNELARLRIHRKRCLRFKAVKSLMCLAELTGRTTNDTSLTKGETVCVAPARGLDSEERSDHEKGGHVRKV